MNGGQASRAIIGLARGLSPGTRFRRDAEVLLEARDTIVKGHGYRRRGGPALLWCERWDGEASLGLDELDPLFIDVCRRVRLIFDGERVLARRVGTEAARILAGEAKGNTGDPWIAVSYGEAKAFTATDAGFTYRVVQRLLGDEFAPGAALVPRERDGDVFLVASVLVRGQGKTGGFHERVLPLPRKVASLLRRPESRADLGRLARERVDLVSTVQNRILRPALKALLQGGPDKLKQDDDRPDRWVRAHDAAIDTVFFEHLWADLDREPGIAAREWAQHVLALARLQLEDAIDASPVPAARRYRAIASAERVFEGAARNHVSVAFPPREVENAE
jgi:CRISPR system Cascade subunit CasA